MTGEEEIIEEAESEIESEKTTRIDTSTEFGQFLVTPQKALKKSIYHKFVQKDLAISYFKKIDWLFMLLKYQQLVDNYLYLSIDGEKQVKFKGKIIRVPKFNPIVDVASVYDSEKLAILNLLRSQEGFEREKLTTITQVKKEIPAKTSSRWFPTRRGGQ